MRVGSAPKQQAGMPGRDDLPPHGLAPGELPWTEARYQTVLRADPTQDGLFFFAVKTTGVFCYPSCSCRKPRRENVRFFAEATAAQRAGFRPCKRCRPDLEGGARAYEQSLVRRAVLLSREAPAEIARQLSVSPAYLNRLFRRQLGESVQQHCLRRRIERAAELLDAGATPLDAANACGFHSPSSFYAAFRRTYGMAPGEYQQRCVDAPGADVQQEARREATADEVHGM